MNYDELLKKYNMAIKYILKLEEENKSLRSELGHDSNQLPSSEPDKKAPINGTILVRESTEIYNNVNDASSNIEKIELYLSLFKGRKDVCAKRWVSTRTGNVGYSPYCLNEWVSGLCGKKNRIKCSKCQNQKYVGLDEMTLRKHFTGEETLGLYPIDLDDKCY